MKLARQTQPSNETGKRNLGFRWGTVLVALLALLAARTTSAQTADQTTFATAATTTLSAAASNSPPSVRLTAPASGGSSVAPASITLAASASDPGGTVVSVSFWANGSLLGTDATSPYTWTLNPVSAGSYQFKAIATDNGGATTTSTSVSYSVTAVAGSASATRSYIYDANERLCKTINPESGATVVDYDAAGNVAWIAEGTNLTSGVCDRASVLETQKVRRYYDALNRLTSVVTPDGAADLTQTYFEDGQTKSLTVGNPGKAGVTTNYDYNKRRLLKSESSSNGSTLFGLGYGYDANGSLSQLTYPDNHVVSYAPDALGRATLVSGTGGVVYARNINYAANGAIKSFNYGNGISHAMESNLRQLPTRSLDSYVNGPATVKVIDDTYSFDSNGNVTDILDQAQNGLTTRGMAYDGLDRLTAAVSPQQWGNAVYAYDALDNLRVADQGSRQYRYNYDAANRLANIKSPVGTPLITLSYDSHGNTVSKNAQAYAFDSVNRMSQVTGVQTYRYDGQGRRVQTTDGDGKTTFWIYGQSGQVLYTSEARRSQNLSYIYLGNTQVATRAVAWGTGLASIRYQHTDALGSPVAETDQNKNIVKRNSYTPYGETFGATVIDGTGYTGHVMDQGTGLTYMQQRYYDPQIGRFSSIDPEGVNDWNGGNFGRYKYARNSPYIFTDPDGRQDCHSCEVSYGASVGLMMGGDSDRFQIWLAGEDAATTAGSGAETGAAVGQGMRTYLDAGDYSGPALFRAAAPLLITVVSHGKVKGAANGVRAGKPHTRAANRLGRERNRDANGGKLICPRCKKPMNEPKQSKKGEPVDPDAAVGDHIIAKSKGGDGATVKDMSNHETLCWICNFFKGDK